MELKRDAVENICDIRYFYLSKEHEEALSRLEYALLHKKQLLLLTGEYGSGKTLLAHILKDRLLPKNFQFVYLGNPFLQPDEIIYQITSSLTTISGSTTQNLFKAKLLDLFTEILKRNLQINKHTVIIFDESHLVEDTRVFEELRVLLNYSWEHRYNLTIVLLGQTELREKLANLPQFKQRITYQYHLKNLNLEEVGEYLKHRLVVSGHKDGELFCKFAVEEIYTITKGLPRAINNVADLSLMIGMEKGVNKIHKEVIQETISELMI